MRIYIYNILSFPSHISLHVSDESATSQIFSEVVARFENPKLTTIFDSNGHMLEDYIKTGHGGLYFAYDKKELPEGFSDYVIKAHMDRVKVLNKKEVTLDIVQLVILGLVTFYTSWFLTQGGIIGALPICAYLGYACFRFDPDQIKPTLNHNLIRLLRRDRRLLYVAIVWMVLKFTVEYLLPQSNGTSPMLVIFSLSLSLFFVLPRALSWLYELVRYRRLGPCYFFQPIIKHPYLAVASVFCLALLVFSDVWFTAFLSMHLSHGKCTPLLSSETKYIEESVMTLKSVLAFIPFNINEFNILESLLDFSTKLGEVGCILPTLITLAVFAQLFVPKRYKILRYMFLSAVLAQVVGGLISAAIKITVHRFRPIAHGNPFLLEGPGLQVINHWAFSKLDLSFPCGHATVTFATCYVFYQGVFAFIKNNRPNFQPSLLMRLAIGAVIFIFPTLTGLSRVASCVHWASDVFAGVLLGICVGSWSVKNNFNFKVEDADKKDVKLMLM